MVGQSRNFLPNARSRWPKTLRCPPGSVAQESLGTSDRRVVVAVPRILLPQRYGPAIRTDGEFRVPADHRFPAVPAEDFRYDKSRPRGSGLSARHLFNGPETLTALCRAVGTRWGWNLTSSPSPDRE